MTTLQHIMGGQDDGFKTSASYNLLIQKGLENQDRKNSIESDYEEDGDAIMKSSEEAQSSTIPSSPDYIFESIIADDDFLQELRTKNPNLLKYLTKERLLQLVDYVIQEPTYFDSPQRCYKLPFQACQGLCVDIPEIREPLFDERDPVMDKIFQFIIKAPKQKALNVTLGGYFNKIISYWLIKVPEQMLSFIIRQKNVVALIFEHLYLTSCITDLLVRICTVQEIQNLSKESYKNLRQEILQACINTLEHNRDDDFITEQLFDILSGIVRKCYQMHNPREFFDQILSPFILQPILDFTFSGGQRSKQGSDFLKTFFYNMFIAEPQSAIQDVMEINFGFQVTHIAGMEVQHENKKEEEQSPSVSETETENDKEVRDKENAMDVDIQAKKPESEGKAMQQEQLLKEKLLSKSQMIYSCQDIDTLLAYQIINFLTKFENELKQQQLGIMEKVKLFEMFETIINLDNENINQGICNKTFCDYLLNEYEQNEKSSSLLSVLNKTFLAIMKQKSCAQLKKKLLLGTQLLFRLCKKLSLSESKQPYSERKDIYPYIKDLVTSMAKLADTQEDFKEILTQSEQYWNALLTQIEEEKSNLAHDWGTKEVPEIDLSKKVEDVIRKHEEQNKGISLLDKGAASTTKDIVQRSVNSRVNLLKHDDVLK